MRTHLRMQSGNLLQMESNKSIVISVNARLEDGAVQQKHWDGFLRAKCETWRLGRLDICMQEESRNYITYSDSQWKGKYDAVERGVVFQTIACRASNVGLQ
jgi:hypothetical protein